MSQQLRHKVYFEIDVVATHPRDDGLPGFFVVGEVVSDDGLVQDLYLCRQGVDVRDDVVKKEPNLRLIARVRLFGALPDVEQLLPLHGRLGHDHLCVRVLARRRP